MLSARQSPPGLQRRWEPATAVCPHGRGLPIVPWGPPRVQIGTQAAGADIGDRHRPPMSRTRLADGSLGGVDPLLANLLRNLTFVGDDVGAEAHSLLGHHSLLHHGLLLGRLGCRR